MNVGRRVLKNAAFLTIGQLVTIATGILWTAIVARYIGPVTYGTYAYATSIFAILVLFINFGFEQLTIRDISQHPELGWHYFHSILKIKISLSILIFGGFLLYGLWEGWSGEWSGIALWVGAIAFVGTLLSLNSSLLYAHEVMGYDTVAKLIRSIMALAVGYLCVQLRLSFPAILAAVTGVTIIQLFITYSFVRRILGTLSAQKEKMVRQLPNALQLLRHSLPFFALMVVGVLYGNVLLILVKNLSQNHAEAGYYAAAHRIFGMTSIIPSMFFQAIFPVFSKSYGESTVQMARMFEQAYRYVLSIAVPVTIGLFLVAPHVIQLIYGQQFIGGAQALRIISISLLNGVGWIMSAALMSMGRQTIHAVISGITLIFVTAIGFLVIPQLGAVGGCWAYNIGAIIGFIVYAYLVFHWLNLNYPTLWVIKVLLASAIMGMVVWKLLPFINFLVVSFIIAPVVYFISLKLLRIFSIEDADFVGRNVPGVFGRFLCSVILADIV